MAAETSIYERFGRAIEREQQDIEKINELSDKLRDVARVSSTVLVALKAGTLRLDQIDIDENGSWQAFPERPVPETNSV